MARLEDLQSVREGLLARMSECSSDQNYAVLGRLLVDVVKQIDELAPDTMKREATPLDEFTQALEARRSGPKTSRRASG